MPAKPAYVETSKAPRLQEIPERNGILGALAVFEVGLPKLWHTRPPPFYNFPPLLDSVRCSLMTIANRLHETVIIAALLLVVLPQPGACSTDDDPPGPGTVSVN